MYLYPPPSFGFTVLYLSSSSSKRFHLICNLLILSSLLFFLGLSYFFPRVPSKSPPIRSSLFLDFSFVLVRSSLTFEEELHRCTLHRFVLFLFHKVFYLLLPCLLQQVFHVVVLWETDSVSVCLGARANSVYIFPKRPSETTSTTRKKYYFPRNRKTFRQK